jgi:hypothetical protein
VFVRLYIQNSEPYKFLPGQLLDTRLELDIYGNVVIIVLFIVVLFTIAGWGYGFQRRYRLFFFQFCSFSFNFLDTLARAMDLCCIDSTGGPLGFALTTKSSFHHTLLIH